MAGGIVRTLPRQSRPAHHKHGNPAAGMIVLGVLAGAALLASYFASRGSGILDLSTFQVDIWLVAMGAGFLAGLLIAGKDITKGDADKDSGNTAHHSNPAGPEGL